MPNLKDFLQMCLFISIDCNHISFPEKYRKQYYKPVDFFKEVNENGDKYLLGSSVEWIKGVGCTDDGRPIIQIQLKEDERFGGAWSCKTCYLP